MFCIFDDFLSNNILLLTKNLNFSIEKMGIGSLFLSIESFLDSLKNFLGKMIEINVTSPCYFIREINQNNNIHFQDKIMQKLENLISEKLSVKL